MRAPGGAIEITSNHIHSSKMESLALVASGIAHDFNNLLTVVYGYADLLSSTLKDELEQRYATFEGSSRAVARACRCSSTENAATASKVPGP